MGRWMKFDERRGGTDYSIATPECGLTAAAPRSPRITFRASSLYYLIICDLRCKQWHHHVSCRAQHRPQRSLRPDPMIVACRPRNSSVKNTSRRATQPLAPHGQPATPDRMKTKLMGKKATTGSVMGCPERIQFMHTLT